MNPVTVEVDENFGAVLNCAVRYCIGRQTYMPSLVIGYITPLLPYLDMRTLKCFERDLAEDRSFGDDAIDRPVWVRFAVDVRNEIKRRG